jgi:hypothetical protein
MHAYRSELSTGDILARTVARLHRENRSDQFPDSEKSFDDADRLVVGQCGFVYRLHTHGMRGWSAKTDNSEKGLCGGSRKRH